MSDDMNSRSISCTLTDADQVRRQRELQEELCSGIQEVVRLEGGYALRFPGEQRWLERAAALIGFERKCCPFLLLELRAEPKTGPIWLRLSGPKGTADFLAETLSACGVDM